MITNKLKVIVSLLALAALSLVLVLTLYQSRKTQTIRSKATGTGSGQILLVPAAVTKHLGETFSAQVKINTGGVAISSVTFRLSYPYAGATPELDVVDITPNNPSTGFADWVFPVKTITRSGGVVTIDFAAINTGMAGFSTGSDTVLATIYFKVNRTLASPIVLSFDPTESRMMTKADNQDILAAPASASYTLSGTPPATANECEVCGGLAGRSCASGLVCHGICVKNDGTTKCGPCSNDSSCTVPLMCVED